LARVLVAEDDALTRRFIQETLEFAGHDVVTASNGGAAIASVDSAGCFDAVITDFAMPHANGVDVIAHTQRIDPMIPCIVVTAFRDLDLAMQAMQAGAVAFIPKPFKSLHLLTILARALERRALADEALRLRFLAPMLERFTMVLANALESKDYETQEHSTRLVGMSDAIARHLGLADAARSVIRFGACLHDIGKVAVPEALLRKPGALTPDEKAILRTHPVVGADILADIDTWEDRPADRPPSPRAFQRRRLPGRAARRWDPARRPHRVGGGRLRRDAHRSPVPARALRRLDPRRAAT